MKPSESQEERTSSEEHPPLQHLPARHPRPPSWSSALIIQLSSAAPSVPMPLLSISSSAPTSFPPSSSLLYAWGRRLRRPGLLQVVFDLLLITAFVYISGGIATSTYFLYVFPIMAASLVISGRAAYLAASPVGHPLRPARRRPCTSGFIPSFSPEHGVRTVPGRSVLSTIFVAWGAFFVIAFLMNYLAGSLRQTRAGAPRRPRRSSSSGSGWPRPGAFRRPWPTRSATPWRPSPDRSRS